MTIHQKGTRCGVGPLKRVACLQRFATLKWYTVVASTVTLVTSAAYAYYSSVQSTIQTVFSLSSADIGIWYAFFEIGSISANILVPYFLSSKSIPKVLTAGFLLGVISYFIQGALHFFTDDANRAYPVTSANITNYDISINTQGLCDASISHVMTSTGPLEVSKTPVDGEDLTEKSVKSRIFLAILCVAGLVNGVGYAPSYSLGMTYIDNNVKPGKSSSKYLSVLLSCWPLGPVIGFAFGAFILQIFVTLEETSLKPDDAGWIGAWWVGYLVWGAAILILLPFLVLFPRQLSDSLDKEHAEGAELEALNENQDSLDMKTEATKDGLSSNQCNDKNTKVRSIRGLFPALFGLITNPLYMLLVVSSCLAAYHIAGWLTFIPKFFEVQFAISPSMASIYSGVIPAFIACVVILVSGFTLSKYNLTLQQDCLLLAVVSLLGLLFFIPLFFVSCEQQNTQVAPAENATCLSACNCNVDDYLPVCHDGVTYRSPCLIGCTNVTRNGEAITYNNCFCNETLTAASGTCEAECNAKYAYVVLNVVSLAVYSIAVTSGIRVIFKSVKAEDKGLALGLQSSMNSLLAWIPGPVLFGQLIDSTCLVWEYPDGAPGNADWKGYCKEYDNDTYRIRYLGTTVGFLASSTFVMFIAWRVSCLPRYRQTAEDSADAQRSKTTKADSYKFDD